MIPSPVLLSLNTMSTAGISNASKSGPRYRARTLGQGVEGDLAISYSPLIYPGVEPFIDFRQLHTGAAQKDKYHINEPPHYTSTFVSLFCSICSSYASSI
jgi:hypothetical protein